MTSRAERVIRDHADRIRDLLIADILEHHDAIVELAVDRATSIGAAEYGDTSFSKTPAALRRERFEEHADAYFYAGAAFDLEVAPVP